MLKAWKCVTRTIGTSKSFLDSSLSTKKKVDTSYLRPRHKIIASGGIPPIELDTETEMAAKRARFGKYGLSSGVKVEELYMTTEEIEEEQAMGLYREYKSVLKEFEHLKTEKKLAEKKRLDELEKNLKKYPDALAKYKSSLVKQEKAKDEKELALEKRIREIQEYFGYWMDPKDPRFEVMLEQKESEEKKAAKMAKKEEIQKKRFAEALLE